MKRYILYFLLFLLFSSQTAVSQNNLVSVSKITGSGQITIPIYNVIAGRVSLPISIQYNATGIKPTDVEGTAGVGWNLSAGGAISRQVRGLPDDVSSDMASVAALGWLNKSNGTKIATMTIANNGSAGALSDVQADINYINTNFGDYSDTEPDLFYLDAPGLSLQFVFGSDAAHTIRTIPYQDVKITYATNAGRITSFTVVNDQGITYIFSAQEISVKKTSETVPTSWFYNDFKQYMNGITYTSSWNLIQMKDIYNNAININYTAGSTKGYSQPRQVFLNGTLNITNLYSIWGNTTPMLVSNITYQEGNGTGSPITAFTFNYTGNSQTHVGFLTGITGFGRNFNFSYTSVAASTTGTTPLTRYFLSNIKDDDCNTPVDYKFSYNAPASLPDSTSLSLDLWGYYNGNATNVSLRPNISINPSNPAYERYHNVTDDNTVNPTVYPYQIKSTGGRWANPGTIGIGSLNKISYPSGGYTSLVLESNYTGIHEQHGS
jgi:hypothetical protein